jgi:hypothetical protein
VTRKKRFKTVAGALRSAGERLYHRVGKNTDQADAALLSGQRKILNNLLPQLGLPTIADNETPIDGIQRLLVIEEMFSDPRKLKALRDCQRWLNNFGRVWHVTGGASYQSGNSRPADPVDLATLKAAMAAAHPDRGGSPEAFVAARRAYEAERDRHKSKKRQGA